MASGDPRFFLGTDSAPHARHTRKRPAAAPASSQRHAAIELYAEVFDAIGALPRLQGFACEFGADFYGLPRNQDSITLVKANLGRPAHYPFGRRDSVPLRAGEIGWRWRDAEYA